MNNEKRNWIYGEKKLFIGKTNNMEKTIRELIAERMKARAFIKSYYAEHSEMPSVAQIKTARTLSEDEAASLNLGVQVDALVAQSEDREPSVISFASSAPGVGMYGSPIFGEVVPANVETLDAPSEPIMS